jgi:gluconate 2-dehydrogenase gamma chain
MTETRRQALKMLGAISATCAFPFAGDELYGQHVHVVTLARGSDLQPYTPAFFTAAEYATLSRLTDVIIPASETPGAAAAGVPEYIDRVVTLNAEHQPLVRAGLAWLERQAKSRFSKEFLALGEAEPVAILQPLSDEIDRQRRETHRARFRTESRGKTVYYVAITDRDVGTPPTSVTSVALESDPELPVRFFRLVKNLTADGYYTSRVGLLEELGYTGNTALGKFPECATREH